VTAPTRICVDAAVAATGASGLSAYADGLVRALRELAEVDLPEPPGGSLPARMAWRELTLPGRAARADVLLATNPELPLRPLPVPAIVVVHDLFPLTHPELTGRAKRLRFGALLPRVCARASAIVCVSEATRAALEEHVPAARGKTVVIGEGPTELPEAAPVRADRPYLLYVGELYRRKNLHTLLRALPGGVDLVLAGRARAGTLEALERQVRDWGLAGRVRHEGFVPPARLAALQAGALGVALPSLAEGFGRPLLDAMAAGTPALASDIPALSELAGGAALLVPDPLDPAAWRAAIERLRTDASLRAELSERGRERARAYDWRGIAERVLELARSLE
jgi:glycosyltransferase involved in cell wall biosynthesis